MSIEYKSVHYAIEDRHYLYLLFNKPLSTEQIALFGITAHSKGQFGVIRYAQIYDHLTNNPLLERVDAYLADTSIFHTKVDLPMLNALHQIGSTHVSASKSRWYNSEKPRNRNELENKMSDALEQLHAQETKTVN